MIDLTLADWLFAIVGALFIGLGKGGLPGAGNITIWIFATVFGSKTSVGVLLPALICADLVAITVYRKHAQWEYIKKLLPVSMLGVVVGFFIFEQVNHEQMRLLIGYILLGMTGLHFFRQWLVSRKKTEGVDDPVPHTWWFVSGTGMLGGIATMVANAAGPVAAFYFMAIRLPKFSFIGTSAWFFFIINVFKLPFQAAANNLSLVSIKTSLFLGMFAALGAFIAPKIVKYIPQKIFGIAVWILIVFAALQMIL